MTETQYVWVPGEWKDGPSTAGGFVPWGSAVVVRDAVTEEPYLVRGEVQGIVEVALAGQRSHMVAGVRAAYVRSEGKYVVARLPGGQLIRVVAEVA